MSQNSQTTQDMDSASMSGRNRNPPVLNFPSQALNDPVLSELAPLLTRRTNEYHQAERAVRQELIQQLKNVRRIGRIKFTYLMNLASSHSMTQAEFNATYNYTTRPLIKKLDEIEAMVNTIEKQAQRLTNYKNVLNNCLEEGHQRNREVNPVPQRTATVYHFDEESESDSEED